MTDAHDPFNHRQLQPDQAREGSAPIDPADPRLGVPPEKFGMKGTPFQTPERRQAVMLILFPPEALRDQPYEVVEAAVFATGAGLLRGVAREIYQAYTSDPISEAATRHLIEAFQGHLEAQQRGGR